MQSRDRRDSGASRLQDVLGRGMKTLVSVGTESDLEIICTGDPYLVYDYFT